MSFEEFPKIKPENKKETPEREPEEKVLNPEEIEQLGVEYRLGSQRFAFLLDFISLSW